MITNTKIKILFVIDTFSIGGREKIVVALANGLSTLEYEVHVLCLCSDIIDLKKELSIKVRFHTLSFLYKQIRGISAFIFWAKGLPKYMQLIKKIQPQIVHTHVFFQHFLFTSFGIKYSFRAIRHFHTIHMSGLFYAEKGLINKFRLSSEKFSVYISRPYIIAIAENVFKICQKNFKKNAADIRCIHNGIDQTRFDYHLRKIIKKEKFGFTDKDILVTYVARMDKGKDHITLLRAWEKTNKLNTNAKLLLAGSGELKNELMKFVLENNLHHSVIFPGDVPNINELLAITDIGVFTSLYEGFSVALIEKMFMKVPVIATAIPAIQQVIIDGETGYLFNPGDFEHLSKLLNKLITNTALRINIGEAAYNSVQKYSLENMIAGHHNYYNHAIKNGNRY